MKQINEIGSFECLSTSQRMTLTSQRSDYVFVFWLLEVENWVKNEKNFLKSRHHWYSSYRIFYILDDILWRYRLSFMIQPKMCVGLFKEHKANLFLLPNLLNMAFILWISSESKSFFFEIRNHFMSHFSAERKQPQALNYSEAVLTSQGFSLGSFSMRKCVRRSRLISDAINSAAWKWSRFPLEPTRAVDD